MYWTPVKRTWVRKRRRGTEEDGRGGKGRGGRGGVATVGPDQVWEKLTPMDL